VRSKRLSTAAHIAAVCVMTMLAAQSAQAQTYKLLYTFAGGSDGGRPEANLTQDAKGNLYGTAYRGGTHDQGRCSS
jgi:hypothetical protein